MSAILQQWLNEGVGLSEEVVDFERQFANGYLLGELLYKFNQQDDFAEFDPRDREHAMIGNFSRAERTLRRLRVKFSAREAAAMLRSQPGAAQRVLYRVKLVLDKLESLPVGRPREGGVRVVCNMPNRRPKPSFDKATSAQFERAVRAAVKSQNDMDMERTLSRFHEHKAELEAAAAEAQRHDEEEKQQRVAERRTEYLTRMREEHNSLHDWQGRGVEEWRLNVTIRRQREAARRRFQAAQKERRARAALRARAANRHECLGDLDRFERSVAARVQSRKARQASSGEPSPGAGPRPELSDDSDEEALQAMGVRAVAPEPGAGVGGPPPADETREQFMLRVAQRVPKARRQAEDATQALEQIRKRREERSAERSARSRRRRRFVASCGGMARAGAGADLAAFMRGSLASRSAAERVLAARLDRVDKFKEVAVRNRAVREQLYAARQEEDARDELRRDARAFALDCAAHEREVQFSLLSADEERARVEMEAHEEAEAVARDALMHIVSFATREAEEQRVRGAPLPEDYCRGLDRLCALGLESGAFVVGGPLRDAPAVTAAARAAGGAAGGGESKDGVEEEEGDDAQGGEESEEDEVAWETPYTVGVAERVAAEDEAAAALRGAVLVDEEGGEGAGAAESEGEAEETGKGGEEEQGE